MINTYKLYERVRREFGIFSDSQPFNDTFFDSLESVRLDLQNRAFVEFDAVDSIDEEIDLDSKYKQAVYKGLKFYINNGPEWNTEQKGDLRGEYFMELRRAQSMYVEDNPPTPYDIAE